MLARLFLAAVCLFPSILLAEDNVAPPGYVALFNGQDLTGWRGLPMKVNPKDETKSSPMSMPERLKATPDELAAAQARGDELAKAHWSAKDGVLLFDGKGQSLCTAKDYANFEMLVDWKIEPKGDSGIYVRGSPQIQIWDPALRNIGSGGLFNNQKNPSNPIKTADKPVGEWNSFKIRMIGEKVSIWLNGELVADNVTLENYWERDKPIYPTGTIELQNHGNTLYFKNIYIKELPPEGFTSLFTGTDLTGWIGNTKGYAVEANSIVCVPSQGGGFLYTDQEYDNFHLSFDFRLPPGANNGIGIRTPTAGDPAYVGMEIQVLDDYAPQYKGKLKPYQYHGSIYGVAAAKPGALKQAGEWNHEEIIADGRNMKIILNGVTIVECNLDEVSTPQTVDGNKHPGLKNERGHIAFCGHGARVEFANLWLKKLDAKK